jgi:hypothetical protein
VTRSNRRKEEKMIKYVTNDGEVFDAGTAANLVDQMRSAAFRKEADVATYMARTAETVASMTGAPIRSGDPEAFIEDLLVFGFLKVTEIGDEDVV